MGGPGAGTSGVPGGRSAVGAPPGFGAAAGQRQPEVPVEVTNQLTALRAESRAATRERSEMAREHQRTLQVCRAENRATKEEVLAVVREEVQQLSNVFVVRMESVQQLVEEEVRMRREDRAARDREMQEMQQEMLRLQAAERAEQPPSREELDRLMARAQAEPGNSELSAAVLAAMMAYQAATDQFNARREQARAGFAEMVQALARSTAEADRRADERLEHLMRGLAGVQGPLVPGAGQAGRPELPAPGGAAGAPQHTPPRRPDGNRGRPVPRVGPSPEAAGRGVEDAEMGEVGGGQGMGGHGGARREASDPRLVRDGVNDDGR